MKEIIGGILISSLIVALVIVGYIYFAPENKDFGGGGAKTTVEVQYSGTSPVGKILILDVKQNDA